VVEKKEKEDVSMYIETHSERKRRAREREGQGEREREDEEERHNTAKKKHILFIALCSNIELNCQHFKKCINRFVGLF
jgi:hypothetical protein